MLNPDLKLNPKLFDEDVEQASTREGYGEGVVIAGEENENVVVLCADLTESTKSDAFAKKFPERFFEVGVAEQNLATIGAGLGVSKKIPFISSYASFSPGRNWEQIRTTIAYNNSNVKIVGAHTGVSVGPDGATHQAIEDIATMRAIPNIDVCVPCDALEAKRATIDIAKIWGPVYLRLTRSKTPLITTKDTSLTPGKIDIFWGSKKPEVVIIGCGPIIYNALLAAKELEEEDKIGSVVLNCRSVKPLDEKRIIELARKYKAVVTVEEHQVIGGMGSAVAECLAKNCPTPMEFIGMQDVYGESGSPEDLIEKYGMGVADIKNAVKRVIKRKK